MQLTLPSSRGNLGVQLTTEVALSGYLSKSLLRQKNLKILFINDMLVMTIACGMEQIPITAKIEFCSISK